MECTDAGQGRVNRIMGKEEQKGGFSALFFFLFNVACFNNDIIVII